MFVAMGSFFTSIADDRIGGTYLTLLNTCSNFGGTYPKFFIFTLVDVLSIKGCSTSAVKDGTSKKYWSSCDACNGQESCTVLIDGYYIMCTICLVIGLVLYLFVYKSRISALQDTTSTTHWRVSFEPKEEMEEEQVGVEERQRQEHLVQA